jgi:hypothetical protein
MPQPVQPRKEIVMSIATPSSTARQPAARPQPVAGADTRRMVARKRRTLVRISAEPSMRSRVEAAFRSQANGIDAPAAQGATNAFYRSSGFNWARYLG